MYRDETVIFQSRTSCDAYYIKNWKGPPTKARGRMTGAPRISNKVLSYYLGPNRKKI